MGVEVDHGEGAEFLGIGAQDRKGDVVIAAKGQAARPGIKDGADMAGQGVGKIRHLGVIKGKVAVVDDGHLFQRVCGPTVGGIIGHQG